MCLLSFQNNQNTERNTLSVCAASVQTQKALCSRACLGQRFANYTRKSYTGTPIAALSASAACGSSKGLYNAARPLRVRPEKRITTVRSLCWGVNAKTQLLRGVLYTIYAQVSLGRPPPPPNRRTSRNLFNYFGSKYALRRPGTYYSWGPRSTWVSATSAQGH